VAQLAIGLLAGRGLITVDNGVATLTEVAPETGHRCLEHARSIVVDEAGMVREQTVRSSSLQCRLLVVL